MIPTYPESVAYVPDGGAVQDGFGHRFKFFLRIFDRRTFLFCHEKLLGNRPATAGKRVLAKGQPADPGTPKQPPSGEGASPTCTGTIQTGLPLRKGSFLAASHGGKRLHTGLDSRVRALRIRIVLAHEVLHIHHLGLDIRADVSW